jgi:hypothetical protein
MAKGRVVPVLLLVITAALMLARVDARCELPPLPKFGRDTVLVYDVRATDDVKKFVVRIAEFVPDRFCEWENATTQGTMFMSAAALENAKVFLNSRLFEAGVDTKGGKNSTALWLSRQIYRDLKDKPKVKLTIDGVDGWMIPQGADTISVEINRSPVVLPVIKTLDDRNSERWFLDSEDNPILIKHSLRRFSQTLATVTTDRPNTLRWIKGRKLTNLPQN